ncbi:MAG TPA: flagellar basal body-associated FliL family protein [Firmicutes bacterium]|jgi:flagellar FliL protein|nr:flagellar basal body-associated FliL family protein [Bacillota bacterium]
MGNNVEKEKKEGKNAEAPGGKRKKLLWIIGGMILFFILVAVGVGVVAVKTGFAGQLLANIISVKAETAADEEPRFMYPVPEILVNITVDGRDRFLSVKFYLGHDEPELEKELEKRMPEIRDAVLKILWEKSIDDINTPEGKELLREEIFQVINGMLHRGQLRGVYFWHVMVQ